MSRYIDADAIDIRAREGYSVNGVLYLPYRDIRKSLDTAPSIDIVRCKECKKANTKECSHSYWDSDWGEWRGYKGDEWYCADGEREGD